MNSLHLGLGKGEGSESDRKAKEWPFRRRPEWSVFASTGEATAAAPSLPKRTASDVTERRASGVFPRAGEVKKVLGTEPNTAGGELARLGG